MIRLLILNILLFLAFILLFVVLAFAIEYLMGTTRHNPETEAAYIGVCFLHIWINWRWIGKSKWSGRYPRLISSLLIVAAYLGYLYIFR
jgi:Na+/melibiose symporter-like transporter